MKIQKKKKMKIKKNLQKNQKIKILDLKKNFF